MKTAIQELMQWMEETEFMVNEGFIDKVHQCLEKEKEQILRAFELGMHECLAYDANSIKYYNQTYNQNK